VRVVIDANLIIERDWHLRGPAAQALLAAARHGRVRVVVPEVAVREVVAAHTERTARESRKLRQAEAALRRLQGPLADQAAQTPHEQGTQQSYESWLRGHLQWSHVEVAPIPEASERLVDRALERRRPFDSKGRTGFRDALIWHTALVGASDTRLTLFATDNSTDFANEDKTGLHPDLVSDLMAGRLGEAAVKFVGSLEEAARVALQPAEDVLGRLRQRLTDEAEWSDEVWGEMQQEVELELSAIDDAGVSVGIESAGGRVDGEIVGSELEDLSLTSGPYAVDAFPLTENVYSVVLEASGDATYSLEVRTSGPWQQHNRLPAGGVLSEDERSAYVHGSAAVRALFDGRYNVETEELTHLSLMGLVDD
jgi:predicted nucleic acid-binding protein